ncbi:MAG: ABC transporter permease [Chloroflexi bacterium]|nr:ABC transporter permease [Chloroflexota bacterium]
MEALTNVLFGTLRVSTPLLLAGMAVLLSQQINMLNIAIEGLMLAGAFSAVVVGAFLGNVWLGLLASMLFAMLFTLIFALFVIDLKANLIVAGLALNILAGGLLAYLLVVWFNTRGVYSPGTLDKLPLITIPIIDQIPFLGAVFSGHGVLTYVSWLSVIFTSLLLYRTPLGTHMRAVGEHKEAAETAGIPVRRVQYTALLIGGAMAGLAGAQLAIGDLTLFSENMTNGRGFIAMAAVFFGAARPGLTALGCLLFGLFDALQIRLQIGTGIPPQLPQMLPYLIVVGTLTMIAVRRKLKGTSI